LELDPFGVVTGITALVLFNFAWNQAPTIEWNEAYVYVLLIIGILCFALFGFVEISVTNNLEEILKGIEEQCIWDLVLQVWVWQSL
jgi:hypothetical protein